MSDSVRHHRRQPTRLCHPWDSPGKNTGVGCHFLLQCMKVKSESEVSQSCPTPSDPMDCQAPPSMGLPTRFLHPWDFPGKSTGLPLPSPTKYTIKPYIPVYPLLEPKSNSHLRWLMPSNISQGTESWAYSADSKI